jgi:hypothetical protein
LGNSKLNETQRNALNAFLLEIQLAKGDTAAAGKTAEKLGGGSTQTPAPGASEGEKGEKGGGGGAAPAPRLAVPDNAARPRGAGAGQARHRQAPAPEQAVRQGRQGDQRQPASCSPSPPDQAEALFLLAEARAGLAESETTRRS